MTTKTSLLGSAALRVSSCALSMTSAADAAAKARKASSEPSLAEQVKQLQAARGVRWSRRCRPRRPPSSRRRRPPRNSCRTPRRAAPTRPPAAAKSAQAKLDMQIQPRSRAWCRPLSRLSPRPPTTIDKMKYKGITITPGGYLEAAGIYRSKNIESDMASRATPRSPSRTRRCRRRKSSASPERQSRLSHLLAQGDISPTMHAVMYGEFDFLVAAQTTPTPTKAIPSRPGPACSMAPSTGTTWASISWPATTGRWRR